MTDHSKEVGGGLSSPSTLEYDRPAGRPRRGMSRANLTAYTFMAPAGLLVLLFFVLPVVLILFLSLTNLSHSNFTTDVTQMTFVGLENFRRLLADQFAAKIFFNTLFYVLVTLSLFNVGMALVIALLSSHINRRAGFIFRALWMLPRITPVIVYILVWRRLLAEPPFGIIAQFNTMLGQATPNYVLTSPWLVVILINGFVGASFGMIIFTSAIESIPRDLMNASLVDGSGYLQRIRYITLPLLRWPLLFVVTYQTLSLLTSFEQIFVMTNGGPGLYRTEVWALAAYHRALSSYFGNAQWGYGSAFAVVLVVIGVVMAVIYMRVFRFNELVAEPKIEDLQ